MSAAAYIPERRRYVLFQWHYEKNKFGGPSTWVLRESPTPWGPWTPFAAAVYPAERYYNPCLMAKFIEDDGLRLWIAANGEWCDCPKLYSLKTMPVGISTSASLKLSANNAQFATGKGMADPAAQTIAVQCGGKAPKDVQIIATEAAPWLTVAGDPQGECLRLTNRIKTAGLGVGNYDVDVILSSPAANPPKARYQVHLEVKQTHDATMPPATAPGLSYEYYEADQFYRLPDFSKLKASRRGVCPLPKGTAPHRQQHFAWRFQGYFMAPADGPYAFFTAYNRPRDLPSTPNN